MQVTELKLSDFFTLFFAETSAAASYSYMSTELTCPNLELKSNRSPSINCPKSIKQYGFMKKCQRICQAMPYVCSIRPEQLETSHLTAAIEQIYDCYIGFVKQGLWKSAQREGYLEEFTLLFLYDMYSRAENKLKRRFSHFQKYLLSFFYSINLMKTCSKYIRNFSSFLTGGYTFGQLFLYICLKNVAVMHNNEHMVSSNIIRKVIRIFQSEQQSNLSLTISQESIEAEDDKLVSINSIFTQPIGGCLSLPKVKMYKIMKTCSVIATSQKDGSNWNDFLTKYFETIEGQEQICFEHVVCSAVARSTYELANGLFHDKNTSRQEEFLEEAFSYVFEILEIVFQEEEPAIRDEKTLKNMVNLRKHYSYMKKLHEENILVVNKFCRKLLKNNFILELYKKYS